jgi:hypothetical protein
MSRDLVGTPRANGLLPSGMKSTLIPFLLALGLTAHGQSSTWDVHPLNMIPCSEWIYPEPGCGGCSSCRMAMDSDPLEMDGGLLQWSADLAMCPHPIDTLGNNVVVITNWPIQANANSYLYGRVEFHQPMRIDTLELTCASWAGPDSVEIALQFNETDPLTTTTVLQDVLTGDYQRHIVTDLGVVPMVGTSAVANIYVRAHGGGDQWFLLKSMRVVASPDQTASIAETSEANVFILPQNAGVNISSAAPIPVSICDASGRISWHRDAIRGTVFVPLTDGLSIVRAGTHVRRIVR